MSSIALGASRFWARNLTAAVLECILRASVKRLLSKCGAPHDVGHAASELRRWGMPRREAGGTESGRRLSESDGRQRTDELGPLGLRTVASISNARRLGTSKPSMAFGDGPAGESRRGPPAA
jgi:hypothetical protein